MQALYSWSSGNELHTYSVQQSDWQTSSVQGNYSITIFFKIHIQVELIGDAYIVAGGLKDCHMDPLIAIANFAFENCTNIVTSRSQCFTGSP